MNAKVIGVNLSRDKAVAALNDGDYVLLELLGEELENHEEINGVFDQRVLGDTPIKRKSTLEVLHVYIQDYCNRQTAENWLMR